MKKRYFVSFSVPLSDGARFRDFVESIECLDSWQEPFTDRGRPFLSHTFDEADPRLAALRELLRKEGIEWSEREEHVYTDDELRSFPLLELSVEREPLDGTSLEFGTTYDLSQACPKCGTGAIQTSPLMVPLSGLPKKGLVCAGFDGETLVAEPLMEALQESDVTGLELRQVRLHGNNEPLPWWQMIASFVMPKMSPATRGIVLSEKDHVIRADFIIRAMPPCPACRRDGRYHETDVPYSIVYDATDVDVSLLPDVVRTWESFGVSGIDKAKPQFSRYGDHRLLVKPKVCDIFRRLKVRHACFTPVRIADCNRSAVCNAKQGRKC
jgi:hypothetical protein